MPRATYSHAAFRRALAGGPRVSAVSLLHTRVAALLCAYCACFSGQMASPSPAPAGRRIGAIFRHVVRERCTVHAPADVETLLDDIDVMRFIKTGWMTVS